MSTPEADPIRLGTRASVLARTQSATVGDALAQAAGRPWREVLIRTHGDDTTRPLDQPGRPGVFVSALRDALLAGDVDVIVHSFKDLPSAPAPGLVLAAVPSRVDRRDALVSVDNVSLMGLREGAVVGTSSPRRAAALLRLRPDLEIRPIRGNVDTRIAKVRAGEYDATVLAVAGMTRIGREDDIAEVLDAMLPAPAQGALAVECRVDDDDLRAALALLDDAQARLATAAERAVLVGIDAACTTAIAAAAERVGDRLVLRAELTAEGRFAESIEEASLSGEAARDALAATALGLRVAGRLSCASPHRPVLLVRAEDNAADAAALSALGLASIADPYLQIVARRGSAEVDALTRSLAAAQGPQTWLVVTSPMAVPMWAAAAGEAAFDDAVRAAVASGVRVAATGERTADTLRSVGFADVLVPEYSSAEGLVAALSATTGTRALFPRGNIALSTLPAGLRALDWTVDEAVVYDTNAVEATPASTVLLGEGVIGAVIVRSPSAVKALASHASLAVDVHLVCSGETTAAAARAAGLTVAAVAPSPTPADMASTVARLVTGA